MFSILQLFLLFLSISLFHVTILGVDVGSIALAAQTLSLDLVHERSLVLVEVVVRLACDVKLVAITAIVLDIFPVGVGWLALALTTSFEKGSLHL